MACKRTITNHNIGKVALQALLMIRFLNPRGFSMLFELISNLFIMALLCGVNLMSPIGAKFIVSTM
jgi:hypothetical protein